MDLDPSLLPAVDLAVAGVLAACCVWALRWSRPVSVLLSATAVTWLLADVWEVTLFWHRALLSHLVLAYPGWRPPTWGAQGAVVAGYVVCVLLPAVLRVAGTRPPTSAVRRGVAAGLPTATAASSSSVGATSA